MAAGRPRSVSPPKDKVIELGKDLVQWATEPTKGKDLRCRYCQWYSLKHHMLKSEWNLLIDLEEFRPYYEQAQAALAQRFIDGSVNQSIAHRLLRIYAPDIKDQEDQDANEEIARQQQHGAVTAETLTAFTALMTQVSSLQSNSKILPDNANNADKAA